MAEEPVFKGEDIEKRIKKVQETYKKVTSKPKPKEKKPKKTDKTDKSEETEEEEKADL